MNEVVVMLFAFTLLGIASRRLGRATYVVMALVILVYVGYAFSKS